LHHALVLQSLLCTQSPVSAGACVVVVSGMSSFEVVVSVVVICVVLGASVVVLGDGDGVPPAAITVMSAQFLNSSPQPAETGPGHVA